MRSTGELLGLGPVIPVLTLQGPADGVPAARALAAGGVRVLEVTLRTDGALEAVRAIAAEVPGAIVGVGTVLEPGQFAAGRAAGARFAVSPGHAPALLDAAADSGLPWLPGIATVSEAMTLAERGYRYMKFFPAEAAGGVAFLRALQAPLPGLHFCPTGGIDAANAAEYLALSNVPCVGGSWLAPQAAIEAADWSRIEALARAALSLSAGTKR